MQILPVYEWTEVYKFALGLCGIIGLAFMIASTILMITFIVRGNISVHVIKDDTEKETEDKEIWKSSTK